MVGQYEELTCPFCNKGVIQALYIPSATRVKTRSTATFGRVTHRTKSPDVWLIRSGCSHCGKVAEEVEKELKRAGII